MSTVIDNVMSNDFKGNTVRSSRPKDVNQQNLKSNKASIQVKTYMLTVRHPYKNRSSSETKRTPLR